MNFYPRYGVLTARILLGLMLVASGIITFLNLPTPYTGAAGAFMEALAATSYMLPLIGTLKILTGISLLTNRYAALMLVAFLPVTINMVLFHIFLDPATIAGSLIILVLHLYLAGAYKEQYRPLFKAR